MVELSDDDIVVYNQRELSSVVNTFVENFEADLVLLSKHQDPEIRKIAEGWTLQIPNIKAFAGLVRLPSRWQRYKTWFHARPRGKQP